MNMPHDKGFAFEIASLKLLPSFFSKTTFISNDMIDNVVMVYASHPHQIMYSW